MKRSHERHALILSTLRSNEFASIEDMAALCETSTQTIRRDVSALSQRGKVLRYHGGARLPDAPGVASYETRSSSQVAEKIAAADLLPGIIEDGSSLFLAGGSTLTLAACALLARQRLTVVTNNIHAAITFYDKEGFDVRVVGGWLKTASGSLVGDGAATAIRGFSLDFAVISTKGITSDGFLLEYDQSLVAPISAMIENARQTVLIADGTKFGSSGIVRAAHLKDVHHFLTDRPVTPAEAAMLQEHGVQLHFPKNARPLRRNEQKTTLIDRTDHLRN